MQPTDKVLEERPLKLRLLAAPAGFGKTSVCLAEFRKAVSSVQNALVNDLLFILPTAEHRERTIDLMTRHDTTGFFYRRVSTFDEVLQSFLKLGGIQFASDVTRQLILKEVIQNASLDYFRAAAGTNGFTDLAARFIAELKESLVRPSEFETFIPDLEKAFPYTGSKYRELLSLYTAYDLRLERDMLKDHHDALFLLEEGLKRNRWAIPRFRHVWIDGFFDFSKLQLAFIRFLALHADGITVTLTLDRRAERQSLFSAVQQTHERLIKMGFKQVDLPDKNHRAENSALAHLERHLFSDGSVNKLTAGEEIQIFEATGIVGELEMIAREIKRIVKTRSINYSDIALIFRNAGPYIGAARSVFAKFNIPIDMHEREELRLNPLAKTIVSMLNIFLHDWKRDDLLNFLKSGYVRANRESVWRFELDAVKNGILLGRDHWMERNDLHEIKTLAKFQDLFLGASSVSQMTALMKEALKEFGISALPIDLDEESKMDHAAFRRINSLLLEITRKFSANVCDFTAFAEALLRLIDVDLFSFHSRDKNKVQIYNVSVARQKEYKVVFLPGLLEKEFPMQVKEDPIFSDAERRIVNAKREILTERLPRQAVERFFFYLGVTRASESLILSCPRFNLEGKDALPSFYVDEVRALFQDDVAVKKQHVQDVLPAIDDVMIIREAAQCAIRSVWQVPEMGSNPDDEEAAVSLFDALVGESWFAKVISDLLTPIEGRITDVRIKRLFQPKEGIHTPTRLEMYGECPYRYFSAEALKLESNEEMIDSRLVGNILHDVLENLFSEVNAKKVQATNLESLRSRCGELLKQAHEKYPLTGDRGYRIKLKKHAIWKMLLRILNSEFAEKRTPLPGLVPSKFEYEFGAPETKDYLVIDTKDGALKLRGKIDRIDVDPTGKYALVIDYKTGKKFTMKRVESGTELQLPLYLLAVERHLKLKPLGGHLYALNSAQSTGFHHEKNLNLAGIVTQKRNKLDDAAWAEIFERVTAFVAAYAKGIREAEIPVRPRDCVKFCAFQDVCRIEKWRLDYIYREMKEEDRKLISETA